MKMITSQIEFEKAKSRDLIKMECAQCKKIFSKSKHYVMADILRSKKQPRKGSFCSRKCGWEASISIKLLLNCKNCGKEISKRPSELKKAKDGNCFCGSSCAAKWTNSHKITGTRRSKLEKWLELKLKYLYPDLDIKYNFILPGKCELDIYIPSLSLAFELNGIFHYEPIYGEENLEKIQNRDSRKFKNCIELKISLCVIDTSSQKYFKEATSGKYLDIITKIINENYCPR